MGSLLEIPEEAGGALDLEVAFDLPLAATPREFGVAVRAARESLEGAAVQLTLNVSAASANGSRRVDVMDVAKPKHGWPGPGFLSRWMNDTGLEGPAYSTTHHTPSGGDTAATCQALCDGDTLCAAWVWVVRGQPAGSADCCLTSAARGCPGVSSSPHNCNPCTITSGVKHPASCTPPTGAPVAFSVQLLEHESLDVRILVDRPVAEVWVRGGRGAFVAASNFSADHASVHLFNNGATAVDARVNAAGMACGWAAELPPPHPKAK